MSQTSDTTPLSFQTILSATERNVLPEGRPVLLGTFSDGETVRALMRLADGDIRFMTKGERIGQLTVETIEEGQLDLSLMGVVTRLTIPGRA